MFVLEALVLTFMTTPLVTWFYPHIFVGELPCRVPTPAIYQSPDNEAVARNQRVTNSGLEEDSKTRFVPDHHIFLPFFGGPDDRLALDFVVQICANPRVRGTVVRLTKCDEVIFSGEAQAVGTEKVGEVLDPKQLEQLNRLTVGSVSLYLSDRGNKS
jgi:hypothetical protein